MTPPQSLPYPMQRHGISLAPTEALMEIPPGYVNIMGYVNESEVNGPPPAAGLSFGCRVACGNAPAVLIQPPGRSTSTNWFR